MTCFELAYRRQQAEVEVSTHRRLKKQVDMKSLQTLTQIQSDPQQQQ